jgi:hypothetical protein
MHRFGRISRALLVVAGVVTAGILVSGGPGQADPVGANGNAGPAGATVAKKPLRAERRTDIVDLACGTSVELPSGSDTTVTVTHYNCTGTTLDLALSVETSDGGVVATSECQEFLSGEAWSWGISANSTARRPTFIYRVTGCVESP